ncbi:rRNA maturation RNase YbeY [Paenibacillus larvae]|uniref:Endoribonuclease YbeY n=1 Tax=Paenibacillus larvae TaxID=1464 RepID=A0AAP5N385_9BACL|nr:rRNA maturation RNase YbeY [Paenibacillus larvae]AQR77371.1 rRNA maturation RNase YbeY [Paenibacillus larvae subsp. larvae]AVF21624.1 putative rRNA maturation factor [Paenibacillus larvae subsp. larvae]ETK27683.1 putative rRNA maturation factor [Paenibacillus larvae subsp. larvae DSM 25719]MCY7477253.1 rRNA maturation RNase YbeY [Paenibacillus larvae]MCY7490670.1 rRNA maturation RNase YbeY [Paenibacillus larvae]
MPLRLDWTNEQEVLDMKQEWIDRLEQLLALAGKEEGIEDGEVTLTFVNNDMIHELNRQYRGIDRPTDVLSFAMQEMGEDELIISYGELDEDGIEAVLEDKIVEPLGDIIISIPKTIEQAEEYGHSFERELGFLFVHGFLHLVGYDHQTEDEEKKMFAKQELILSQAGLLR